MTITNSIFHVRSDESFILQKKTCFVQVLKLSFAMSNTLLALRIHIFSGVGGFGGSGGVRASSPSVAPTPPPSTKKILTGFLLFAWAPLGSSGGGGGGPDLWTPPRPPRPRPAMPLHMMMVIKAVARVFAQGV